MAGMSLMAAAVAVVALASHALPQSSGVFAAAAAWSPGAMAGVLGLGFLFGLRHATDADHIAAVGAIVSARHGWRAAVRTGLLWGLGHTLAIVVAGLFVLVLHMTIPERVARLLEFVVALTIIGLGGYALAMALRSRHDVHIHIHEHDGVVHRHLHFHGPEDAHPPGPAADHGPGGHRVTGSGIRPLVVGVIHGLAGSAALTLLVLAQIPSAPLGLAYLACFGLGSIGGMALMSLAISLPFTMTAGRPGMHRGLRLAAGLSSLGFGLIYAWSFLSPGL